MPRISKSYKHLLTLNTNRGPILSLSFSHKGVFIVVTGNNATVIYDLSGSHPRAVPIPSEAAGQTYNVSSWLHVSSAEQCILALGSSSGDLHLWQWDEDIRAFKLMCSAISEVVSPVMSIDTKATGSEAEVGRIAISRENRDIVVWSVSSRTYVLTQTFSVSLPQNIIPSTIKFSKYDGNLIVWSLIGGTMALLHHTSGERVRTDSGPYLMGSVCVDEDSDRAAAWTGRNTFELLQYSTMFCIKSLDAGRSLFSSPKAVAFVEHAKYVITGSDTGRAIIYDAHGGQKIQTIGYPGGGLVDLIAAVDLPDRHLIAITDSSAQQRSAVALFQRSTSATRRETQWMTAIFVARFVIVALVIAIACDLYDFIQDTPSPNDILWSEMLKRVEGYIKAM